MNPRLPTWSRLCPLLVASIVSGCGGGGGHDGEADGGLRGPEGGVLRFDAAMLHSSADAGAPGPVDGGPAPPRDSGGPIVIDSGRRTCAGSAWSCSLVGASRCSSQRGCRLDGECSGLSRSCYSITYSSGCYSQDGCYWSSSSSSCSGSARSCYSYYGSATCHGQDGCDWDDTCEGVATSCSLLSEHECELQEGCYLR